MTSVQKARLGWETFNCSCGVTSAFKGYVNRGQQGFDICGGLKRVISGLGGPLVVGIHGHPRFGSLKAGARWRQHRAEKGRDVLRFRGGGRNSRRKAQPRWHADTGTAVQHSAGRAGARRGFRREWRGQVVQQAVFAFAKAVML